jgi:hypothetical protein
MRFLRYALALCFLAYGSPAFAQAISTLPSASALTGTETLPCVQSGATDGCTANQIRTLTQTLPSAALAGSPGAGLQEYEGTAFYGTPSASDRGVIPTVQFMSLTADYTLSNVNTVQKALNGTTNGQITAPSTTGYLFDASLVITNTGTISHTWAFSIAGTATFTAAGTYMMCTGVTNTSSAMAATSQGYTLTPGTAYVITAASTSNTENVTIHCWGRVNVNVGGTLIPSVQMSAAPGGSQATKAGSSFYLFPIGTNTVVDQGNWN